MIIEKIDSELYKALYIKRDENKYKELWNRISNDKKILKEAIKVYKDKFNQQSVKGLTICEQILFNWKDVDKEIYDELINLIYSNKKIARIIINGYINGGYSYLLISLFNDKLRLTEEQKKFCVDEAMNKIGTTDYYYAIKYLSHDPRVFENFSSLSYTQAHGSGCFDIRYYILHNSNWTNTEKRKLVYNFYGNDEDYINHLDEFKWNVLNYFENFDDSLFFDFEELYNFDYEKLMKIFNDDEMAKYLLDEIEFCKMLTNVRPPIYKNERAKQKELSS